MGATRETLFSAEQVPESSYVWERPGWNPLPTDQEEIARRQPVRRRKEERWSSSLNARDLRSLLTALEDTVIPALVAGYAPSHTAPIDNGDQTS